MYMQKDSFGLDLPMPDVGKPIEFVKTLSRPLKPTGMILQSEQFHPDNEFFIPVHGFVRLTDDEMEIIDHPAFQRLAEIYQLGQAHLVFRGATHKRMEHVLGTVHVSQMMIDAIDSNYRMAHAPKKRKTLAARTLPLCAPLTIQEQAFIRLAALLHDIGHLPAGHTLEDELKLLCKHDSEERLTLVFDRDDWLGDKIDTLRKIIDERYARFCPTKEVTPTEILFAIITKEPSKIVISSDKENAGKVQLPKDFRTHICRDIVGNTICADLLDYLHRDWYHIGKPRYLETRLFQYMEIREDLNGRHEFVISLGQIPRIRTDAITAIVSLMESRYELAECVLFHRSKCAAAAMLERAIQELRYAPTIMNKQSWDKSLEKELLDDSDLGMVRTLLNKAKELPAAARPLRALLKRKLYQPVFSIAYREAVRHFDILHARFSAPDGDDEKGAADKIRLCRLDSLRKVEIDFKFPPGSLAMYFPSKAMNAKIPEVKIHVDGMIQTFEKWNSDHEEMMDAGHMKAQNRRFRRLWRVFVCLDEEIHQTLDSAMLEYLGSVIREMMFSISGDILTSDEVAFKLARLGTTIPGSPFFQKDLLPLKKAAQEIDLQQKYPSGAPMLSNFFSAEQRSQ